MSCDGFEFESVSVIEMSRKDDINCDGFVEEAISITETAQKHRTEILKRTNPS